jgi:hypothetical protein
MCLGGKKILCTFHGPLSGMQLQVIWGQGSYACSGAAKSIISIALVVPLDLYKQIEIRDYYISIIRTSKVMLLDKNGQES